MADFYRGTASLRRENRQLVCLRERGKIAEELTPEQTLKKSESNGQARVWIAGGARTAKLPEKRGLRS